MRSHTFQYNVASAPGAAAAHRACSTPCAARRELPAPPNGHRLQGPHPLGDLQHACSVVHALQLDASQRGYEAGDEVDHQHKRDAQQDLRSGGVRPCRSARSGGHLTRACRACAAGAARQREASSPGSWEAPCSRAGHSGSAGAGLADALEYPRVSGSSSVPSGAHPEEDPEALVVVGHHVVV